MERLLSLEEPSEAGAHDNLAMGPVSEMTGFSSVVDKTREKNGRDTVTLSPVWGLTRGSGWCLDGSRNRLLEGEHLGGMGSPEGGLRGRIQAPAAFHPVGEWTEREGQTQGREGF